MVRNNDVEQLNKLADLWESGDTAAGNEFIERVQPLVRCYVGMLSYQRFESRVDTNDLVQIILQKISEVCLRGDLSKDVTKFFNGWLKQFVANIVTREIRNHCAQKRDWRRQSQLVETASDQSKDPRRSADLKLMVEEVLSTLSPAERELALQLATGNSQAEIAAAMNVSTRTIRRQITALRQPFLKYGVKPSMN